MKWPWSKPEKIKHMADVPQEETIETTTSNLSRVDITNDGTRLVYNNNGSLVMSMGAPIRASDYVMYTNNRMIPSPRLISNSSRINSTSFNIAPTPDEKFETLKKDFEELKKSFEEYKAHVNKILSTENVDELAREQIYDQVKKDLIDKGEQL